MRYWTLCLLLFVSGNLTAAPKNYLPLPGAEAGTQMAIYETTVGEFREFIADTGYNAEGNMFTLGPDDYDWLPRGHTWANPGYQQEPTHPVVGVNIGDARAYAAWLTTKSRADGTIGKDEAFRLPNDLEWSLAAGLTDEKGATPEERLANANSGYPWGMNWPPPPNYGNFAGTESAAGKPTWWGTIPGGYTDAFPRTAPVGSYAPNPLGFYDLSGNVWEWVDEVYTTSSIARIIRGGCWGSDRPAYLLLAKRNPTFVSTRNDELGFRLVLAKAGAVSEAKEASAPVAQVPVRVELDWIKNAQFAGLLVALERGWYREAGLDVTISEVDQKTLQTVEPVVAADGKPGVTIGVADGNAIIRARAGGAPIQVFATMFQASPIGIVTLESSGISDLAALKGKRIGLHAYDHPQLAKMLASAGLKPSDVTAVELGDDHHSLPDGKVDAQVAYVIDEKVAFETAGHPVKAFYGYEHGYKAYSQVYFTTENTRKMQGAVLEKFLAASNRGWRAAVADPTATAKLIVAKYQPKLAVAYQEGSLRLIADLLQVESGGGSMGKMREATWQGTPDATPELVKALWAPLE